MTSKEFFEKRFIGSETDNGIRSKQTNFERIKAMSVEEMAEAIQNITNSDIDVVFCQNKKECNEKLDDFCLENDVFDVDLPCRNCIIEWLESEVEEDD